MAEQFLETVREKLDGQIVSHMLSITTELSAPHHDHTARMTDKHQDFEGQRLAEQISTNALAVIGVRSSCPVSHYAFH